MKKIDKIISDFSNTPDLIIREFKNGFKKVHILYLESVASGDRVNNYLLRNLGVNSKNKISSKTLLSAPNVKEIKDDDIEFYLCNGFTIVIDDKTVYAMETKADLDRSISVTEVEPAIYSPKDSLVENYQKNIGLIKKRIKSKDLKIIESKHGKYTNTNLGLLYINSIAKPELVNLIQEKLKKINTDQIVASGELKQFLIKEKYNVFPSIKLTERPDTIVKALLEGKVVIIVDTSPFALIMPAVLADFINPPSDDYTTGINVNFLKVLRFICLLITIVLPAYYIAITTFNPESIPVKLMMNIAKQRLGVPFSSMAEATVMLLICELLRESDLRFPSSYGSAISILGALILGDAAVSAGIASPIMIIIIAVTFVSSLMFSDLAMNGAIRSWRYIFLIFASIFGLYGIMICFLFLLVNLCAYESFTVPYMMPIAPFNLAYFKETLFKSKKKNDYLRSKYLTNNIRKQR